MSAPPKSHSTRLWRRLAALVYDSLVLLGLLLVLTAAIVAARGGVGIAPGSGWFQALLAFAVWLYFGWSWTHGGQTVGMRAWRLRLQSETGAPVGWAQAAIRFAAGCLSALLLGLGFWWSLVDSDRRCWHDRLSRTRLVHVPRSRK